MPVSDKPEQIVRDGVSQRSDCIAGAPQKLAGSKNGKEPSKLYSIPDSFLNFFVAPVKQQPPQHGTFETHIDQTEVSPADSSDRITWTSGTPVERHSKESECKEQKARKRPNKKRSCGAVVSNQWNWMTDQHKKLLLQAQNNLSHLRSIGAPAMRVQEVVSVIDHFIRSKGEGALLLYQALLK
jgi:hypothetical protein